MERRRSSVATPRASSTKGDDSVVVARKHKPDYRIVLFTGLLMMIGLVIMYAIGPQRANVLNTAYGTDYSGTYFFLKQGFSLILALVAFALAASIPFKLFRMFAGKVLLIAFIAAVMLAIAGWFNLGIAQCSLGACRWFNLGPLGSFQPSELMKFGMLLFAAGFLGTRVRQGLINDTHKTLIPLGIIMLVAIIFIIGIQKDMGTGLALVAIVGSMLLVSGLSYRWISIIGVALLGAMIILIAIAPHRIARVATFLQGDSTSLSDDSSYHIVHAKIAIGSGGLFGVGIGNSVQATGYLPEAINDSVFAIMGETFGFVGLTIVIMLFLGLLMRILHTADYLEDMRLRLMVVGVFGWLASHVILNIAAMIGIFPLTGITLPLLSFGGTSMIFIAAALGLVFQLSRYTSFSKIKESGHENSRSWRGVGGTRHTGRRRPQSAQR